LRRQISASRSMLANYIIDLDRRNHNTVPRNETAQPKPNLVSTIPV
jgi:hypothetical protein